MTHRERRSKTKKIEEYDYGQIRGVNSRTSPEYFSLLDGKGDLPPPVANGDLEMLPLVFIFCPCGDSVGHLVLRNPRERDSRLPLHYVIQSRRRYYRSDGSHYWQELKYPLMPGKVSQATPIRPECPHCGPLKPIDLKALLATARKSMGRVSEPWAEQLSKPQTGRPLRIYVQPDPTAPRLICDRQRLSPEETLHRLKSLRKERLAQLAELGDTSASS